MLTPPSGGETRVGPYQIEAKLGRGGMGTVFRARHVETGIVHALKLLDGGASPRTVARFRREAEVLARLDPHPGVVRVHAVGEDRGRLWCALDLIEGRPLSTRLQERGGLEPDEAARVVAAIARALDHVHAAGVLHRDLKPANVLLDEEGRPHLVDFGIAFDATEMNRLTNTGELVGTPAYMAPEQVSRAGDAGNLRPTTDVYGAGAVLYAALTGRPPFEAPSSMQVAFLVTRRRPVPPHEVDPAVPEALSAICLKALEKRPEDRYRNAAALADELDRFRSGGRVAARSSGRLVSLAERLAPSSPRVRLLSFVALAVVLLAVAGLTLRVTTTPAAAGLPELESTILAGRPLEAAQLARLRQIADASSEPGERARADLLGLVSEALAGDDGGEARAVDALALRIRSLDEQEAAEVQAILARGGRWRTLGTILFGRRPVALPAPEVAADLLAALAKALAVAPIDDAVGPFSFLADESTFLHLIELEGVGAETRGRLLAARGQILATDEARADEALDAFIRAKRELGIDADVRVWPAPLRERAADRLVELVGPDLPGACALAELLAAGEPDGLLPEELAAALALLSRDIFSRVSSLGRADPARWELVERGACLKSLMTRHGELPVSEGQLIVARSALGAEWVVDYGERMIARGETGGGESGALAFATRVLIAGHRANTAGEQLRRIGRRWTAILARRGPDERWLHAIHAWLLVDLGEREMALEPARAALAADRELPDVQRWPIIPELVAHVELRGKPTAEARRRAGALYAEAARIADAVAPRMNRIAEAGDGKSFVYDRSRSILAALIRSADRLLADGPPGCCGGRPDESIDALTAAARRVASKGESMAMTHERESRHHLGHDRVEEAIAALGLARDAEEARWIENRRLDHEQGKRLVDYCEQRARLLRQLGREDDAAAEDERAASYRPGQR